MISVIICSSNPGLLKSAINNITVSIGTTFEILYQDNRELNEGICKVYNDLAAKSQFPYLCFVHEDIHFDNENWGAQLEKIFENDEKTGLIGIAGCKYKSRYFSGWFSSREELDCANYIHQYPDRSEKAFLSPGNNRSLQEVVCIDGLFMCCRKTLWEQCRFNEADLKGFHFYDIDFSLRCAHFMKVVVSYDIGLTHFTRGGDYGNRWVNIAIAWHLRERNNLPFFKTGVDKKSADDKIIKVNLDFLKNYKITIKNKFRWIFLQKLYLKPHLYYSIIKFFVYKPFGLDKLHRLFKSK